MAINGTWYNELGSTLTIVDNGNGTLSGTYVSGVGAPAGKSFPLVGSYDPSAPLPVPLGFSVAWDGWSSNTTWCGLLFEGGAIVTTWILASTINTTTEGWWQSMNVGMDNFTPNQPSRESVEARISMHGASHPLHERR